VAGLLAVLLAWISSSKAAVSKGAAAAAAGGGEVAEDFLGVTGVDEDDVVDEDGVATRFSRVGPPLRWGDCCCCCCCCCLLGDDVGNGANRSSSGSAKGDEDDCGCGGASVDVDVGVVAVEPIMELTGFKSDDSSDPGVSSSSAPAVAPAAVPA